jgi:hypothetical protein
MSDNSGVVYQQEVLKRVLAQHEEEKTRLEVNVANIQPVIGVTALVEPTEA